MKMDQPKVVVLGLGYVGLPLAIALADTFDVRGLDIDESRIEELRRGHDRTREITPDRLVASRLQLTADVADCVGANVYIVTVPTPVDADNRPDLGPLMSATRAVAGLIDAACTPIVVYESTVYPGVTEEVCAPEIERVSGLVCGRDFFVGYSPERINPGDREHTVDRITKVVSGQTPAVLDALADLYGRITTGGVFRAASIKAAEAAKVIENAQRDINIAFMNEIAQIFARLGMSVWDVLEAAGTKWNFLKFQPGLVGGHCIGVDPYYLSFRANELGHDPRVILAGRAINDGMAEWTAGEIHHAAGGQAGSALVLGLTFKEDVPDIRNSKVVDLVAALERHGHDVTIHDPHADANETQHEYNLKLDSGALSRRYDLVVLAVAHQVYRDMGVADVTALVADGGTLADLKNAFAKATLPAHVAHHWQL